MYGKTFAERLQWLIDDISVSNAAKRIGIGESTLRLYLNGAVPSLDRAIMIADAYQVSFEWLCKGVGEPTIPADYKNFPQKIHISNVQRAAYLFQDFLDRFKYPTNADIAKDMTGYLAQRCQVGDTITDEGLHAAYRLSIPESWFKPKDNDS